MKKKESICRTVGLQKAFSRYLGTSLCPCLNCVTHTFAEVDTWAGGGSGPEPHSEAPAANESRRRARSAAGLRSLNFPSFEFKLSHWAIFRILRTQVDSDSHRNPALSYRNRPLRFCGLADFSA